MAGGEKLLSFVQFPHTSRQTSTSQEKFFLVIYLQNIWPLTPSREWMAGHRLLNSPPLGPVGPCHAACRSPPASSALASGGAGGPVLRGAGARERSFPGPPSGGLSGCPSGGLHVPDRL